jgi:hypothetical protein
MIALEGRSSNAERDNTPFVMLIDDFPATLISISTWKIPIRGLDGVHPIWE